MKPPFGYLLAVATLAMFVHATATAAPAADVQRMLAAQGSAR